MGQKWSEKFLVTRAALQTLITDSDVNYPGFYLISNGVGSTKVIRVEALTDASISTLAVNVTDGTVGTYDITADTFTKTPSSDLVVFRQSLTTAQVKTINSVPVDITLLPAPGAGYAWVIVDAEFNYTHVTAAFGTASPLQLLTETAATAQVISGVNLSVYNSTRTIHFTKNTAPTISIVDNKKMQITSGADTATGDGSIIVYGLARKITV